MSKYDLILGNLALDLTHFDNTNVTTDTGLSAEMKTYYDNYLIDNAEPELVHDQFGQKRSIPKNKGKVVEFRKYSPFAKALTPLTEGVTPSGKKLTVTTITATVAQYGDYVELSDVLMLTAIDNNLTEATELLGSQAGRTLDTITREVLNSGTNVQYADAQVNTRYKLVGGDTTNGNNHYHTVDVTRRAVRNLKINNAKQIDGNYVSIIHPDVVYDIQGDSAWLDSHKYAKPEELYTGEVGKIHGVRYVETTEAKVFHAEDLVATGGGNDARTLTVASFNAGTKTITIDEALAADEASALAGRKIIVDGYQYTVVSATAGVAGAATITIYETATHEPSSGDVAYPGEAGAEGRDVYSTIYIAKNAYGVTDVTGGGLEFIVQQLGSGGTADPLKQRATAGWKAIKTAIILVQNYLLRVETASTFEVGAN